MKKILTLAIFILLAKVLAAQTPVIEYDPKTKALKGSIPYDKAFIIKIPYIEEVQFVDYYKLTNTKTWYEEISKQIDKKGSFTISSIGKENINVVEDDGKKYLYLKFDNTNTFKPNKNYEVVINKGDAEGLSIFDTYHNQKLYSDKTGSSKNYINWYTNYQAYKDKQLEKYGLNYMVPEDVEEIYSVYQDHLKKEYKKIDSLTNLIKKDSLKSNLTFKEGLKCLAIDTVKNDCFDCKNLDILISLNEYNIKELNLIAMGKITIGSTSIKTKCIDKTANIKASIAAIDPVFKRLSFNLASDLCDSSTYISLKNYRDLLHKNLEKQKQICTSRKKINGIIYQSYFHLPLDINVSTFTASFEARGKARIIPDFGLAAFGFQKDFFGVTPYIGFHVNLVPIDKDIAWKVYPNKTLLTRSSIMFAWTLTGVEEEGKRENLFNNYSFLAGYGFKLNHMIQITAGGLMFNKIDPNPTINTKSFAMAPYVGLSVDADLKEMLNGILDIIK